MAALASSRASAAFFGSRVAAPSVAARRAVAIAPLHVVAAYGDLPNVGGGKKWEHYDLTKNGKPVRIKMHVKKGDTVQVIAGKDKGKVSTVLSVDTKTGEVLVEGANVKTKHVAPKREGEQGQIKTLEFPLHHSNVMLYSKEKQVRSRVGHKVTEGGKKVRYLVKTGELLDQ